MIHDASLRMALAFFLSFVAKPVRTGVYICVFIFDGSAMLEAKKKAGRSAGEEKKSRLPLLFIDLNFCSR